MSRVRTSIHGRLVGLNHQDEMQAQGLALGDNGKQFRLNSPKVVTLYDDFVNSVLSTNWTAKPGSDVTANVPNIALLAGGIGGVMRLSSGDGGTGFASDAIEMVGNLQWQASNGGLAIESRFKISQATLIYFYFGFTDLAATLEAPVSLSGTTFTTNATDAVGFLFDTAATTDTIRLVGVKTDVDATMQDSTKVPVADKYATFRIELTDTGAADFYYNGVQVGTRMANALNPATDLTPVLIVSKESGVSVVTLDCDYIHVTMNRGKDGDAF